MATDYENALQLPLAQKVLGHHLSLDEDSPPFVPGVLSRIDFLLRNAENINSLADVGNAALNAFLQSTVTGPPLPFHSAELIFPKAYRAEESAISQLRNLLLETLSVDGEAIYELTPNIELFWFARCIYNHEVIASRVGGRRQRARTNFVHQRLLFEHSETLQNMIYADLDAEEARLRTPDVDPGTRAEFLTERATIHTLYGLDGEARKDLAEAARLRHFSYALTGRLGKRTKFQQYDLSQLVVVARSADTLAADDGSDTRAASATEVPDRNQTKPENIALNDDTLLEKIAFKENEKTANLPQIEESSSLPPSLASLDPANQPLLSPQDSIILLSIASSITNTSPTDGLTREETLPYALRVLEGGSSNWQIYTQALLVRSRIEGFNSRTTERGLLQLQALVDQVIADTTGAPNGSEGAPTTFLPKPKASDSAPAEERLRYIYSLASPFRWTLEAELASRWITMGGLRTALEIYERLQMWAEVALCFAATDQENKAIAVVRKQLFQASESDSSSFKGPELPSLPGDAPRYFCILGDLEPSQAVQHYTRAWEISRSRYARAQRSLARLYAKQRSYELAAEAYKMSLKVNRINAPTWFSLGCVQLELEDYPGAAASFTQMVQLEESDAEGWSNLAVALLRMPVTADTETAPSAQATDEEHSETVTTNLGSLSIAEKQYQNRLSALRALQRATSLKPTDHRLWDNYLTVSSSLPPSLTPWPQLLQAQRKLLSLKPSESTIDISILARLTNHITSTPYPSKTPTKGSLITQFLTMLDKEVVPLITSEPELWYLISQANSWRNRPAAALDAEEKAWRIITNRPGAYETETGFAAMATATKRLVEAYKDLGPRPREGLGRSEAISSSQEDAEEEDQTAADAPPVLSSWSFKARSAIRSVMGKGKTYWEDSTSMELLTEIAEELKKK